MTVIPKNSGLLLTLRGGDVIVHPAGTGHSNILNTLLTLLTWRTGYGSPRWVSCNGDTKLDWNNPLAETTAVRMLPDPVLGNDGHLNVLWSGPRKAYFFKAGKLS